MNLDLKLGALGAEPGDDFSIVRKILKLGALGADSSISVELAPHDHLQAHIAEVFDPRFDPSIVIRSGTRVRLIADIPQTESLIYDLQQCLKQLTDRMHNLHGDSMRSTNSTTARSPDS